MARNIQLANGDRLELLGEAATLQGEQLAELVKKIASDPGKAVKDKICRKPPTPEELAQQAKEQAEAKAEERKAALAERRAEQEGEAKEVALAAKRKADAEAKKAQGNPADGKEEAK